jgi:hypothetical protein
MLSGITLAAAGGTTITFECRYVARAVADQGVPVRQAGIDVCAVASEIYCEG